MTFIIDNSFQYKDEINLDKVKYFRANKNFTRSENWENGLNQCKNEFITVLGDDDGYFPNSNYMVNNIVLNLDYNISKLVISPDKSIPIIIPLMKLNIHNLKFRLNYLNIKKIRYLNLFLVGV